jgi:putative transcriptional regulator
MTIRHHPSDETLTSYAAGTMSAATRIVVASHIEGCRRCAAEVGRFEAIGGALLDTAPETELSEDCFPHLMARIDRLGTVERAPKKAIFALPKHADGIVLPRALHGCDVGPWRWIGPGIHMSRVRVPDAPKSNLILLKVGANRPLPEHGHTGTEYTQVLTGSLVDGSLKLMPGDIMEADHDLQHQPVAGPEGDCISLAAVEGKLRIPGLIGRTVLSLVGL